MRYLYSVVKFVPDPIRGEFINVGAIVGSDETNEWQLRMISTTKRARCLDDKRLLPLVLGFGDSVGRKLDAFTYAVEMDKEVDAEVSETWLTRLYEESMNVIQLSPPTPVLADDIEAAIDIVFEQFIVETQGSSRPYENKLSALAAMRRTYISKGLAKGQHFKERATIMGEVHRERFDFSVLNGKVVQLVQAWSFQNPDQDALAERVKAWAWTVEDVRDHGGRVILSDSDRYIKVPKDVRIDALYIPPAEREQREVFEEALSAFKRISVTPVAIAEVDVIGEEALRLLEVADAAPRQRRL